MQSHTRIANIDISTPQGLSTAYRHGATEFLICAEALEKSSAKNLTGHYVVTLHALELGLKAFLAKTGLTEIVLSKRPYGHDLLALHSEALKRGFAATIPDIDKTLKHLNQYHNKGAVLRYNFSERRELPLCSDLFPLVSALLK